MKRSARTWSSRAADDATTPEPSSSRAHRAARGGPLVKYTSPATPPRSMSRERKATWRVMTRMIGSYEAMYAQRTTGSRRLALSEIVEFARAEGHALPPWVEIASAVYDWAWPRVYAPLWEDDAFHG